MFDRTRQYDHRILWNHNHTLKCIIYASVQLNRHFANDHGTTATGVVTICGKCGTGTTGRTNVRATRGNPPFNIEQSRYSSLYRYVAFVIHRNLKHHYIFNVSSTPSNFKISIFKPKAAKCWWWHINIPHFTKTIMLTQITSKCILSLLNYLSAVLISIYHAHFHLELHGDLWLREIASI